MPYSFRDERALVDHGQICSLSACYSD